jgi:ribokinase
MTQSVTWVIGNANVDLTSYLAVLPEPGQTVMSDDFTIGMGGKGANQAVAASRAGGSVAFIGRVGTDSFGDFVRNNLLLEHMDLSRLETVRGSSGVANIYVDRSGANQIAVFPGASAHLTPQVAKEALGTIASNDYLVSQLEIDQETVLEALRAAREAGATTVLNIAPYAPLLPGILDNTTWLIANELELRDLLQDRGLSNTLDLTNVNRIPDQIQEWVTSLGCNLVVTLGDKGAIGCVEGVEPFWFQPGPVDAIDTVGAGDCFVGFFVAFLQQRLPWQKALAGGVIAASESVQAAGAQESFPEHTRAEAIFQKAREQRLEDSS